jgi:Undecaprenyl-phosphate glucose phosphotransferase
MRRRRIPAAIFTGLVKASDPLLLLASSGLAWLIAPQLLGPTLGPEPLGGGDLLATLIAAWIAMICLQRGDTYRLTRLLSYAAQFRWLSICLAAGAAALVLASMVVHFGERPVPAWVALWLAVNGVGLGVVRVVVVRAAIRLRRDRRLAQRVALLGATESGRAFLHDVRGHNLNDIDLVGLYDDTSAAEAVARLGLPFLGGLPQLESDSQNGMLDAVVITQPSGDSARMVDFSDRLGHLVLDVYVAPNVAATPYLELCSLGGVPVGLLARRPLSDWQIVQKAIFDRTLAALLIIAFAPVLALLALLIRLDTPGPVLFRQRRIGFNNRPFDCLKFRSMHHHMSDALADRQTTRGDRRITRVGQWLRRYSLDELPQLFNVLRGDMSLVGPRPHAPNTKAASRLFPDIVADYARRHRVKPGITGWAQVNGWRGETQTEEEIEQRVLHDLHYIQNWSLLWDLRILLMTAVRLCGDPKAF